MEMMVWAMNVIKTAKIIAVRIGFLDRPPAVVVRVMRSRWCVAAGRRDCRAGRMGRSCRARIVGRPGVVLTGDDKRLSALRAFDVCERWLTGRSASRPPRFGGRDLGGDADGEAGMFDCLLGSALFEC
jgi:hypothetical protein